MAKSGHSSNCQTMVGTPVRPVIFSRSISSSALAGDQRYIRTSFMPPAIAGIQHRVRAGDVEERHGQQEGGLRARRRAAEAAARRCAARPRARREADADQVGDGVAMGAERPLRPPGRAGGVEDGRRIVRLDAVVGRRRIGQRGVADGRRRSASSSGTAGPSAPLGRAHGDDAARSRPSRYGFSRSSRSASTMATLVPELLTP